MQTKTTILSAALAAALLLPISPAQAASARESQDVTASFISAGVNGPDLRAIEVGGILILRGSAATPADGDRAAQFARELGYARVANLIRVADPVDDGAIERLAERELSRHRGLDGTNIRIKSQRGVVNLSGHVAQELQKDMAVSLIRNID